MECLASSFLFELISRFVGTFLPNPGIMAFQIIISLVANGELIAINPVIKCSFFHRLIQTERSFIYGKFPMTVKTGQKSPA
jgi:hypothetical protein